MQRLTLGSVMAGVLGFLMASEPLTARAEGSLLAAEKHAASRFDPSQTGTSRYPVARGTFHVDLRKEKRVPSGPINVMTLASRSLYFMWAISSKGVAYVDVSGDQFRQVTRWSAEGVPRLAASKLDDVLSKPITELPALEKAIRRTWRVTEEKWTPALGGETYAVVDHDNVLYVNGGPKGTTLYAITLLDPKRPESGLRVLQRLDLADALKNADGSPGQSLVGLNLTPDGRLIAVGRQSLAVLDRRLTRLPYVVTFGKDEHVSEGAAVDERGGIYVASDRVMHKIVWDGLELSTDEGDGAWTAPYDLGREPPAGKSGTGTGSAPVLMGFGNAPDRLVVITDGADRMKLVAFWRDAIPEGFKQQAGTRSKRIAGQIAVTCGLSPVPRFVQSDQSVVAHGYGAFVVNGARAKGGDNPLVDVLATGPIFEPSTGVERFEWDPKADRWRSVWARSDAVSMSMVPTKSSASDIVFVNGYSALTGWEITGMDWETGETVHRTAFGHDNLGNGAHGSIQFLPGGDLLFMT